MPTRARSRRGYAGVDGACCSGATPRPPRTRQRCCTGPANAAPVFPAARCARARSAVPSKRWRRFRPNASCAGTPRRARALGGAVEARATFPPDRFVRGTAASRARTLLADRGGALIVRVPLGRGAVVYVSDPRLFANAALARDDNARLAYLLARPRQPGRITAFDEALHGALLERGWLGTLSVPVRVALAGTVLTILIALAGGALRLAPPVTLRAPREPASDEFIRSE